MYLSNLLPLALTASAFLVPAEVKGDLDMVKQIPSISKNKHIELECAGGCPALIQKSDTEAGWTHGPENKLGADISVEGDKVLFNGQQIWPQAIHPPLSIKQSSAGISDVPVSTSIEYKPEEVLVDPHHHMSIHPISIEILAVMDKVVHAETVEVRVAETEAGLGLLPSRIRPYEASPYTDSCTTVWCRVKGTIAKKFNEWRQAATSKINKWRGGCRGQRTHLANGPPLKGGPAKYGPGSTLHPQGGFKGHHHGHHGHHRGNLFAHLLRTFILGASVGAVIGMVSYFFVAVIRRFRAQPEYVVVEQVEIEEGRGDGLPKNEEVYREPQVAFEDEKKELLQ